MCLLVSGSSLRPETWQDTIGLHAYVKRLGCDVECRYGFMTGRFLMLDGTAPLRLQVVGGSVLRTGLNGVQR